jgi:GABA permease
VQITERPVGFFLREEKPTGWTYSLFLTKVVSMSSTQSSNGLEQGLKPRHVTMLSIAGVIGAGLFVGSGHAIAAAGPAVLLAYAAAGTAGGAGHAHAR